MTEKSPDVPAPDKSNLSWSNDPDKLKEDLMERALPFDSLKAWYLGDNASYTKAQRADIHREIAAKLGWKQVARTRWPKDPQELLNALIIRAQEFENLTEWQRGDQASYQKAYTSDLQYDVANRLGWGRECNDKDPEPDFPGS